MKTYYHWMSVLMIVLIVLCVINDNWVAVIGWLYALILLIMLKNVIE